MPFSHLPARLVEIRDRIAAAAVRGGHGQQVTIVAVTKTFGVEAAAAAWDAGLRDVGENRVQEATAKMEATDLPLRWHLIGHLQRNKVKALDRFALLHSLDSLRLARAVSGWAVEEGRTMDALVQVNASGEESKGGFAPDEVADASLELAALPGLRILGVMTMAPYTDDERVLRRAFAGARAAGATIAAAGHPATELSMGMSNDYEIAVEEGATCVRLGTILFGARPA